MISYTIVPRRPNNPEICHVFGIIDAVGDDSVRNRTCGDRARRSNMDNMDWDHGLSDGAEPLSPRTMFFQIPMPGRQQCRTLHVKTQKHGNSRDYVPGGRR